MSLKLLLAELKIAGISLHLKEDKLNIKSSVSPIPPDALAKIKQHKAELLAHLQQAQQRGNNLYKLTPAQKLQGLAISTQQWSLWPLYQMGQSHSYNIPLWYDLRGELNTDRFSSALIQVYKTFDALQSVFSESHDSVKMHVKPDVSWSPAVISGNESLVQEYYQQEQTREFDLKTGPLFVAVLIRLATNHHVLLLNFPHIIMDGWSIEQLWKVLIATYNATEVQLPEFGYLDYLASQKQSKLAQSHWLQRLQGYQTIQWHNITPPAVTNNESHIRYQAFDGHALAKLKQRAQECNISLFGAALHCFGKAMAQFLGCRDTVISTPFANRTQAQWQRVAGYFVSMLPVRVDSRQSLADFQSQLQADLDCELCDINALLPELDLQVVDGQHPLQQVVFAWQDGVISKQQLRGVEVEQRNTQLSKSKFPLGLSVFPADNGYQLKWEYDQRLLSIETIILLESLFLQQMISVPVQRPQLHQVQVSQHSVLSLFAEQVRQRPESVAVRAGECLLTYNELWQQGLHIAHHLIAKGVTTGESVGICTPRGLPMASAILGIVMAGAVYVPLLAEEPQARLQEQIAQCKLRFCLSDKGIIPGVQTLQVKTLLDELCAPQSLTNIAPRQPVYINFSSGTTGRPKGIRCLHQGVVRLVHQANYMQLGPETRMLSAASQAFDAFTLEFWGPLLNGGEVHLLTAPQLDNIQLRHMIAEQGVNCAWLTAALFHTLVDIDASAFIGLRQLLVGGDVVSAPHVRQLYEIDAQISIINGYGPTENTTFTSCFTIPRNWPLDEALPVGKSIRGTQVCLLDKEGFEVPQGAIGELVTVGAGLAQGYLDKSQEEDHFIELRLQNGSCRAYRTGDLAFIDKQGLIRFVGRKDQQVKINGFRVELEAIDRKLVALSDVAQAITVALKVGERQQLVSFVRPLQAPSEVTEVGQYRHDLKQQLPHYMVPGVILAVPEIFLTSNGKADRRTLSQLFENWSTSALSNTEPLSELETTVASVWQQVLACGPLTANSDFFLAGGNSILAIKVAGSIGKLLNRHLSITDVLRHPILSDFAHCINQSEQQNRQEINLLSAQEKAMGVAISAQQASLWPLYKMGQARAYNMPFCYRLSGRLDLTKLQDALKQLYTDTDPLHSVFVERGDEVRMVPAVKAHWQAEYTKGNETTLKTLLQHEIERDFDLTQDALFVARICQLAPERHGLVLNFPHIVMDGWSVDIFWQALNSLYQGSNQEKACDYYDYLTHRQSLSAPAKHWQQRLADYQTPTPHNLNHLQSGDTTLGRHCVALSAADLKALQQFASSSNATLFSACLKLWGNTVARYLGASEVVISTPYANREAAHTHSVMGYLVSMVPIRISAQQSLQQFQSLLLNDLAMADNDFNALLPALGMQAEAGKHPLQNLVFSWQEGLEKQVQLGDVTIQRENSPAAHAKFPLNLTVSNKKQLYQLTWEFDTAVYSEATVQRLAELLLAAINNRSTPWPSFVAAQNSHSTTQQSQLLTMLHKQVLSRPDEIAIQAGMEGLSYQVLWQQSQHLAAKLQQLGVTVGESIAIALPRDTQLSIAIVAIAMAGAVYVPFAQGNSEQYQQKLVVDAGIRYCLTDKASFAGLHCFSVSELLQSEPASYRTPTLQADSPLYINFSSGTTGKPKGIICLHQGVTRLVDNPDFMDLGTDTHMLCASATAFDAFTLEFWGPLLNGGCVHMLDARQLDTAQLQNKIQHEGVNTLWLTAALFHTLVDIDVRAFDGIEQLLTGGDVVSPVHSNKLYNVNPNIRIINGYGPTENTTFTCCYSIDRHWPENEALPIGFSIKDTDVVLLDEHRRPVPDGCIGELVTAGKGLAAGYLDKTQEKQRFIDLHLSEGKVRAYRTGDLAYKDNQGRYRFVGRADQMVKVNGFRIELEAIDRALIALHGVQNAITLAIKNGNNQQLVSFVLDSDSTAQTTVANQLKAGLSAQLPSHMLPAVILKVANFPTKISNKVDRQQMVRQYRDWQQNADQQETSPLTPTEVKVARVWQAVLDVDAVQVQSHFYQLGGNSLLLLKAHAALMETFDCHLDLAICLKHLLLSELAQAIESATNTSGAALPSVQVEVGSAFPLSTEQQRLYLTQALQPSIAYNVPCLIPLPQNVGFEQACQLIQQLLRAHPILAVQLVEQHGQILQQVKPAQNTMPEQHQCVSMEAMESLFSSISQRHIDLFNSVIECHFIEVDSQHPWLVLNIHHIAFDGQSILPLMQTFKALLAADVPETDDGFFRHISWQQSETFSKLLEQQASYWQQRLSQVEESTLLPYLSTPTECRRASRLSVALPATLIAEVNRVNRQLNISEYTFWAGLLCLVLGRANHSLSATLATPVAKRLHLEENQSIGFFANTLMLNAQWTEELSAAQYLTRLQQQVSNDLCHQLLPLDQVIEIHKQQGHALTNLSEVLFSLTRVDNSERIRLGTNPDVKYDFSLTLSLSESHATAQVEYRQCAYNDAMVTEVINALVYLARQVVADTSVAIADLQLVDRELQLVNEQSSDTETIQDWPDLVPMQILKTAACHPERIAITDNDRSLTYRQLVDGAKQISAHLQWAGVQQGDRVAVMIKRHAGLPQTLLAVLLTGATYVPLDPDYPQARLDYFMQDAQPWGGICDTEFMSQWQTGKWLDYQVLATTSAAQPWQAVALQPDQLSHLIYTSGSTGQPKGVMIKHRGVRSLQAWAADYYSPQELQYVYGATSVCFDLSVFEIFITWSLGGTLHFAQNALDLIDDLQHKPITLINTVPSVLQEVLKFQDLNADIRVVNLAGEPLPPELAKRLYQYCADLRVINLYGPSEDTTYSTVFQVNKTQPDNILIGKPLPGTTALVCDTMGRQMPNYFNGELRLSGEGLAAGYWNKPELSRDKFATLQERGLFYKTGDLVRYQEDQQMAYIGRIDDQIKLRGFRIELGEINNLILAHPQVLESCTLVTGKAGEEQITSFVVAAKAPLDIAQIQLNLAVTLPHYMLPSELRAIDKMPLTPSGKQDKKALKAMAPVKPETISIDWSEFSASAQWCKQTFNELLPHAQIGPDSSFFNHGGNSLLAVSLVKAIRNKFDLEITFRDLFASPSPVKLGAWVDNQLEASQKEGEEIII